MCRIEYIQSFSVFSFENAVLYIVAAIPPSQGSFNFGPPFLRSKARFALFSPPHNLVMLLDQCCRWDWGNISFSWAKEWIKPPNIPARCQLLCEIRVQNPLSCSSVGDWNIKHVNKIALFKCNQNIISADKRRFSSSSTFMKSALQDTLILTLHELLAEQRKVTQSKFRNLQ